MRNLGLIGGLSPAATIHYYRELAKTPSGELLIVHADMNRVLADVQKQNVNELAAYFAGLIERLAHGGAEVAAISAIAPHICIRELKKISPLPLVDVVQAAAEEIALRRYKRVSLFGTRSVIESRLYGMLDNVEVFMPSPEQIDAIHSAYMRIVEGSLEETATLSRIARELPVNAIVFAGTDLSRVFNLNNTYFPHIDCAKVHIHAILQELHR